MDGSRWRRQNRRTCASPSFLLNITGCSRTVRSSQVATGHFSVISLPLLSPLKFVGRWALKEHNPWLHHRFRNIETCLRRLRISYHKPVHQLICRHIKKVDFTAGPKLLRARPIVFAFLSRPKTEIEDDVRSQFKRSTGDLPKHHLNETVSGIMFRLLSILPK